MERYKTVKIKDICGFKFRCIRLFLRRIFKLVVVRNAFLDKIILNKIY